MKKWEYKGFFFFFSQKWGNLTFTCNPNFISILNMCLSSNQNPDGTLSKAAMMQSALAKERREMKQATERAEAENIPTGMNKNWIDPMPESKPLVGLLLVLSRIQNFLHCLFFFFFLLTILSRNKNIPSGLKVIWSIGNAGSSPYSKNKWKVFLKLLTMKCRCLVA